MKWNRFLFRLKYLIKLRLNFPLDAELIPKFLEELQFFSFFEFKYNREKVTIKIEHPKRYRVSVDGKRAKANDLEAAIQLFENKI